MRIIYLHSIQTPLGKMIAGVSPSGVHLLEFSNPERVERQKSEILEESETGTKFREDPHPMHERLHEELDAYFTGMLKRFTLPVSPHGTEFQLRVWKRLRKIPFGRTESYDAVTRSLGDPKAIRAVAKANGANPIAILVPCHRVIGKDGSLTGYAGGLDRKRKLIDLERRVAGDAAYRPGDQMELM